MSTLLVLTFDNKTGARVMVDQVQTLQRQQLITLADAATVIRQEDGRIKIKQLNNLVGAGAFGGAFWGLFVGTLFWSSWLDPAKADCAPPKTPNCGLDEAFMLEVHSAIKAGYSALFMIVAYVANEEVYVTLAENTATFQKAYLSPESEAMLSEAFGVVEEF
ncbi:MAG: DUF1269 domain-containing protein [Anaerolineales bacterium]|nr:DUF1269 domain-containing protein [Anaerolineales bacterium]